MAIYKGTAGKRIGSVGNETYSMTKGQNVVREKPAQVANPRTDAQMTQRSQFLSAVRFYQRANQNFFRFAFESKKSVESDYNAFMRLNAKVGGYITKAQGDAVGFPMIAPFTISQGSIVSPDYGIDKVLVSQQTNAQMIIASTAGTGDAPTTIAGVSELILAEYPSYRNGDIITCVTLFSSALNDFYNDLDAESFRQSGDNIIWNVCQFILDTTNTAPLSETGLTCVKADGKMILSRSVGPVNIVAGCAFVVSRNESTGLKVSTSSVSLSSTAATAYDAMRSNAHRELVLAWWGAQQSAILQGSFAEPVTPSGKPRVNAVNGQYNLPASFGLEQGASESAAIGFVSAPTGVTTDDFRVEGVATGAVTLNYSSVDSGLTITVSASGTGTGMIYYLNQPIIGFEISD